LHTVAAAKAWAERATKFSESEIAFAEALEKAAEGGDDEGDGVVSALAIALRVSSEARNVAVAQALKALQVPSPERLSECSKEESKARDAHEQALNKFLSAPPASMRRREVNLILSRERHEIARFDLAAMLDDERVLRAGGLSSSARFFCANFKVLYSATNVCIYNLKALWLPLSQSLLRLALLLCLHAKFVFMLHHRLSVLPASYFG